ncbi:DUF4233 domain-containing protein [Actinotalea sp.]|uniref:DUF4233 domain-containing protein n=1 Tax=Actinotalea sp. TaxID=1872145 RepID=UPI0035666AB2
MSAPEFDDAVPPVEESATGELASSPAGGAEPRPVSGAARSARRQFASTILVLEAFVVLFAALVAFGLREIDPAVVGIAGGALVLSLVLAAGVLRRPGGYVVGSVLQVALLATAFAVPMMLVVGAIFVALWVTGLRLGGRIDRERAERLAADD